MTLTPSTLYHYTSAEGLKGIIQSDSLWATWIFQFNDRLEYQHGEQLTKIALGSKLGATTGPSRLVRGALYDAWGGRTLTDAFVVSLSEQRDQLSQWRGYCASGGYCIGFDGAELLNAVQSLGHRLEQCLYSEFDKLQKLESIIQENIAEFSSTILDEPTRVDHIVKLNQEVRRVVSTLKHESFHEEKEWRIVAAGSSPFSVAKWRTRGPQLVPYLELRVGARSLIREIVTGPTVNCELAQYTLDSLLRRTYGLDVPVNGSNSPLI